MIQHVHHINILIRDIEQSLLRYRQLLGDTPAIREELPDRGVRTARFKVGEMCLVLVQPIADGVPARTLAARGEGVFLMSFAVEGLGGAAQWMHDRGIDTDGPSRSGLDSWRVIDLDASIQTGLTLQLCSETSDA